MTVERSGYKKIFSGDSEEKVNWFSFLFFQWMNDVIKTGSKRALEDTDFLPLSKENTTRSVTEQLQTKWEDELTKSRQKGKSPKLWKSIMKMVSAKDLLTIMLTGILDSCCRIIQPLFLGYLISTLGSDEEPRKNLRLYMCAVAMAFNAFVKSMSMQHFSFKNELLGIRLSSAIKGVIYRKVCSLKLVLLLALTPPSFYQRVWLLETQQTTAKAVISWQQGYIKTGRRENTRWQENFANW